MPLGGCFSALASAAGASPRAANTAAKLDAAAIESVARALVEDPAPPWEPLEVPRDDDPSLLARHTVEESDEWVCALPDGERQAVRAHSALGARATCYATNDVAEIGDTCACVRLGP